MMLFAWRTYGSPFGRLRDEMNRLFDRSFFGRGAFPRWFERRSRFAQVNMTETAEALTVTCELPGVNRDDIETSIEGGVLTIRGERSAAQDRQAECYHRRERGYGPFERVLELPAKVDLANVTAKFTDGVLEIVLPKHPDTKPKRIEVKVS